MDKLEHYRKIVSKLIHEYAQYKPYHGQIEPEVVIDPERDHYELILVGWDGIRRVHGSVVHIDIINEKIWIQYDGTTRAVADQLLSAGIPKEEIVLAFYHPEDRQYTDYAVE